MAVKKDIIISERIDRNGTKHQEVETGCSRCGGQGQSDRWVFSGKVCYKCNGSGRQREKRKIYTPEHEEKLRLKRQAREEKKLQEIREGAQESNRETLEKWGYAQEKIYVVKGDTFEIKDELKAAGARFNKQINSWFFSEKKSEWETYELETSKLVWFNNNGLVIQSFDEDTWKYIKSQKNEGQAVSEHVGQAGDKIEMELTVVKSFLIDGMYGYTYINKMADADGNILVWKTAKDMEEYADENGKIKIKGTIKEHDEYNGEKQTQLTRCKVIEGDSK